jgi:hypothetical protein
MAEVYESSANDNDQDDNAQETPSSKQIHEAKPVTALLPARFQCSICGKSLKTQQGVADHTRAMHDTRRTRKRKHTHNVSTTTTHVSSMSGGQVITSLVMERGDALSPTPKKPTESQKRQKLAALLELLKQKAKDPPVKFVVDVDNVGTIENVLEFFKDRDVYVIFYVKNQLNLTIPSFERFRVPYEVSLVESCDDDDMAALTEALNQNCFIVTCDKYESYLKSGLVDTNWLDAHRVPCIWKKSFGAADAKTKPSKFTLSIPFFRTYS